MRKNTEQYKAVEEAKHLAKELRNDIYNLTDMDKYQEWHTWCANHNPGGSPGIEMCWNGERAWAWAAQGAAIFSLTSLTACLFSKGGPGKGEKVAERPPLGVTSTDAVVTATPVFRFAVQTNDEEKVRELLKEGGDVNEADTFHMTAVHYAAQNGFKTILQDLIDAKANVNVKNKFGMDPIYMAAAMGWADCVDLLKAAGGEGEPYSTPEMEHLLREICSPCWLDRFLPQVGVTPVKSKREKQVTLSMQCGMLCAEASVELGCTKIEPEVAPPEFRIEKVRELIGLGVDVSAPDKTGKTALYFSIRNGHKEIAKLLIEAGADCSVCDLQANSILDRAWLKRFVHGKTDEDKELYDLIEEKGGTLITKKTTEERRAAKE